VPLSDHEQRLLEQMERALYQEDPKFASSLRHGRGGGLNRKRIVVGCLAALTGLGVVVAGVATSLPAVGVFGFALMVAGAVWAWSSARTDPQAKAAAGGGPAGPARGPAAPQARTSGPTASPFMTKMEQRWRKRREGGQGL
jgi:hypothetical protein